MPPRATTAKPEKPAKPEIPAIPGATTEMNGITEITRLLVRLRLPVVLLPLAGTGRVFPGVFPWVDAN